jgi:hypothetical protein
MIYDAKDAWSRPSIGRLSGIVLSVGPDGNFTVIDFRGQTWKVRFATSSNMMTAPEASSTVRMVGVSEPFSGIFIVSSYHEWGE